LIGTEVVALHHQSLFGMTPQEAKQVCSFELRILHNGY
jgi:hypothetical protein